GLRRPETMPLAHQLTNDLVQTVERGRIRRLHDDSVQVVPRMRDARHLRMERCDHLAVQREAEHRTLLLEDADDGERKAMNANLPSDRIEAGEVSLGDLLADHDHRGAEGVFLLVVDASVREREVLDQEVLGGCSLSEYPGSSLRKLGARVRARDIVHRPARAVW